MAAASARSPSNTWFNLPARGTGASWHGEPRGTVEGCPGAPQRRTWGGCAEAKGKGALGWGRALPLNRAFSTGTSAMGRASRTPTCALPMAGQSSVPAHAKPGTSCSCQQYRKSRRAPCSASSPQPRAPSAAKTRRVSGLSPSPRAHSSPAAPASSAFAKATSGERGGGNSRSLRWEGRR